MQAVAGKRAYRQFAHNHTNAVELAVFFKQLNHRAYGHMRRHNCARPANVPHMKLVHPCAKKLVFDLVFAVDNLKRHRLDSLRRWRWLADKIALTVRHIKADEGRQLFFCLNALGNDARVGEGSKLLHAFDERLTG